MDYDYNIKKMGFNKLGELLDVLTDYTANGSFASLAKNVTVKDEQDYAKWIRIQNLDNHNYDEDNHDGIDGVNATEYSACRCGTYVCLFQGVDDIQGK